MRIVLIPVLALATAFAVADDGWLGYPGSPKQFNAKPTVRMASERVTVVIHRWHADVRCDFVFENQGPAVAVKMGFPDFHSNWEIGEKAKTIYERFISYVDGRRVRTTLEPKLYAKTSGGIDAPSAFQTKVVQFSKNQQHRVVELYRVHLGSLALSGTTPKAHYPAIKAFDYIFHTGSTWRGSIGKATMRIRFAKDATLPRGRLTIGDYPPDGNWTYEFFASKRSQLHIVQPGWKLSGRVLILQKRNWKPTMDDDVEIFFGPHFRDVDDRLR